jgi:uncharacterized membrane protein (TIGR02234 family)
MTPAGPAGGAARRALLVWVALGVAGAVLALFGSGRAWATVAFSGGPAGARVAPVTQAGGDLVPVLSPLALASLAAVVAVLATRGPWRRVIGILLTLFGLAIAVTAWRGASAAHVVEAAREHSTLSGTSGAIVSAAWAWPAITVAGGLVLLAAGVLAVARGGRWPGMSARYDRPRPSSGGGSEPPAERPGAAERSLWDALDRGVDPTDGPPGERFPGAVEMVSPPFPGARRSGL